jgi:hypothetical protein
MQMNDDNRKTVSDRNFSVSLLENLKTFLARLFSDLVRNLKIISWNVRVENQIEIPREMTISNQIDPRPELMAAIQAVKEIPEIDLSPVVAAIQALVEKPESEYPEQDDSMVVEAIKCVETAIQSLPCTKEVDMSSVEDKLNKLIDIMTPKPLPKMEMPKAVKMPVWLSEECVYNKDEELISVINHYDTMDIIEEKQEILKDGLWRKIWTRREVKV